MIRAVLFDMDGVLVDSEQFIRRAAMMMFEEKGYRVQEEDFLPFTGTGENRFIGGVAEKYGIPLDIEKDKARTYLIYEQICAGNLEPLPGVHDTIARCDSLGLKKAVTTSADEFKMLVNLKEIGIPVESFDVAVFADMVKNKKPHPEIFLTAAGMLEVKARECLVIEDAPSGLKAARVAGMRSLALCTTFQPAELDIADWIIPDLSHIREEILAW
jgi:HAD superfamily hydrolase (TIGR01509 family)